MRSVSQNTTDLLRSAGGVLLAAGAVALLARKSGAGGWGEFALLLVVLVPSLALYGLALAGVGLGASDDAQAWRSVLMITAILLAPIALVLLLQTLGVEKLAPLETAGVFAATAVIAAYGAARVGARYAALLAGLAALVAWLILWGQILHHPSAGAFRVVLIGGAALLLIAASLLERAGAIGTDEVATAAGVAAVGAGTIGVFVGTFTGLFLPFTHALGHAQTGATSLLGIQHPSGLQSFGWDLYLLVVSLALIVLGAHVRSRGLGYVGGFGALTFVYSVAAEITRLESGRGHTSSLVGWPLALLALGILGLAAPALARSEA